MNIKEILRPNKWKVIGILTFFVLSALPIVITKREGDMIVFLGQELFGQAGFITYSYVAIILWLLIAACIIGSLIYYARTDIDKIKFFQPKWWITLTLILIQAIIAYLLFALIGGGVTTFLLAMAAIAMGISMIIIPSYLIMCLIVLIFKKK